MMTMIRMLASLHTFGRITAWISRNPICLHSYGIWVSSKRFAEIMLFKLHYLGHESASVRLSCASALSDAAEHFSTQIGPTIEGLEALYAEKAKILQPEYDRFVSMLRSTDMHLNTLLGNGYSRDARPIRPIRSSDSRCFSPRKDGTSHSPIPCRSHFRFPNLPRSTRGSETRSPQGDAQRCHRHR